MGNPGQNELGQPRERKANATLEENKPDNPLVKALNATESNRA